MSGYDHAKAEAKRNETIIASVNELKARLKGIQAHFETELNLFRKHFLHSQIVELKSQIKAREVHIR